MRIQDFLETWRRPRRPQRVGLVLSGGAVRGAAHVGVLQVFDEHGIRPDLVVGASAGAVVGGLYCAGLSPLELERIGKEIHWTRLGRLVRVVCEQEQGRQHRGRWHGRRRVQERRDRDVPDRPRE